MPEKDMEIQLAEPQDLPTVMAILAEAAAWLKEKGIDQWPSPPNEHWQRRMVEAIDRKEVYTIGQGHKRFGIVRLTWADPYWPDDGLAGYIHSMAIRPSRQGQGVGGVILEWAANEISARGRRAIRLDCLASNGRLRGYYEEQGFIFQSALTDHDYSAALYEKAV